MTMNIFDHIHVDPDAEIPLVTQLTQHIVWLIASTELKAGDQLPTIRDLAQTLGIHMHTVRAAYHRLEARGLVSMRTRRGTVVLPFDPEMITETGSDFQSFLFGVLLPAPVAVYQPFVEAIYRAASESHWMPVLCYTGDNPLLAERTIHQLIAKDVDGFIVTSTCVTRSFEELIKIDRFPPIVFVDSPHIQRNSIVCDLEGAACLATNHLLEHGHHQIGLITAPLEWENVRPCYRGYQRALEAYGLQPDPDLVMEVPDFDRQSGYAGGLELLSRDRIPEAVFVIADNLALGALQAAEDTGVSVPDDLAITSFNDIEMAALVRPSLTTATFPAYEMGVLAVQMLLNLLSGQEAVEAQVMLESHLVVRQSCGCRTS